MLRGRGVASFALVLMQLIVQVVRRSQQLSCNRKHSKRLLHWLTGEQ